MPRKGKEKTKRERTGSYDHLTKNQREAAIRQSENALREQQEALERVEEVLQLKELQEHIEENTLDKDSPEAKYNTRCQKSEKQLTNNKPLTTVMQPRHVAAVRRRVYNTVLRNINRAEEVLSGKRKWSNQQVSLFTKMMNKVIPDLHHSVADVQHSFSGSVSDLPLEKLVEIAMDEDDANTIDGEIIPDQPDEVNDFALEEPERVVPDVIKKRRKPNPPSNPHTFAKSKRKTVNRKSDIVEPENSQDDATST